MDRSLWWARCYTRLQTAERRDRRGVFQQRDYILRLIETVGVMIRRALELARGERPAEALELLDQAVQQLTDTSPALLERLTPDGLVTFLGAGGPVDPLTGAAIADALDVRAEALEGIGRTGAAEHAAAQAEALRAALPTRGVS
ncbi:MAG TPA: hypothetical protein VF902_04225 [Coriobacteriia bacterium]